MERFDHLSTQQLVGRLKAASPSDWPYLLRVLQLRKDAGPAVAQLVRDADPKLKLITITLLDHKTVTNRAIITSLIAALHDEDARVRRQAATGLGVSGNAIAVEPLMIQTNDPDVSVQKAAIEALGKLGDTRATRVLIQRLASADKDIRLSAVKALHQLDDTTSIDPLIAALTDSNPVVRQWTVKALARLGRDSIVEALNSMTHDPDTQVRYEVLAALGELGDRRAVAPLIDVLLNDTLILVRIRATIALGKLGDRRAVQPLVVTLSHKDTELRCAAAEALAEVGDPAAITPLQRAVMGERSKKVRECFQTSIADLAHSGNKATKGDIPREQWLYRTWLQNPTMDAGSEMYTFHEDGTGEVEDFHMGITRDHRRFTYRVTGETLAFLFAKRKQWVQATFSIERSTYRDPIEGNQPCLKLVFEREPYFTEFGPVKNSTYYNIL